MTTKTQTPTPTTSKQLFTLTATHEGLGRVKFILEAEDRNAAFSKFRAIVFSHKQWIIKSNEDTPRPFQEESTLLDLP